MATMSSWISLIFLLPVGLWSIAYVVSSIIRKWPTTVGGRNRLPPGPRALPILGNLHMLGELPHQILHKLATQYGPIMYMRLGKIPTVVVSSPDAAQQFLKTHDLVFASRPYLEAVKHMAYNGKGMAFTDYGPYWRNARILCTLELLSNRKIESFKSMRSEEVRHLVWSIKTSSKAHDAVDLSDMVASLNADMTCRMVLGKKYVEESLDKRGFKALIEEMMWLSAAFNLADYIPYIGVLDLQGLTRRMKVTSKAFDSFLEKIMDEHVDSKEKGHDRDFVDVMLSLMDSEGGAFEVNRTNAKAILQVRERRMEKC